MPALSDDGTGRLDVRGPAFEGKVIARRRHLGGRWRDLKRAAVPLDLRADTRVTVTIEPHRCIDVLAAPSEEPSAIVLVAEDDAGRVVARGEQDDRDRSLVLCSATGEDVTLVLHPRGSPGAAGLVVGISVDAAEAEIPETTRVDRPSATRALATERLALETALHAAGYDAASVLATGDAKVGSRTSADVKIPEGCARIDAVAGAPLGPLSAALWDTRGTLIAEAQGGARATLFTCGPRRDGRVEVEALTHFGPFAVEMRALPSSPPSMQAHALAASRLLEGLYGVETVMPSNLDTVRAARLTTTTRVTEPIDVPSGVCVEVGAAIDAGGSGVELALTGGAEGDTITRGRFVAADRVCADKAATSVTATLRLSTGETDALVLVRELPP